VLPPGARLPSVRDCAQRHRVSPATVVGAYDLLQAQGLVEARPQRGLLRARGRSARAGAAGARALPARSHPSTPPR